MSHQIVSREEWLRARTAQRASDCSNLFALSSHTGLERPGSEKPLK
jgi:hypothetical protein